MKHIVKHPEAKLSQTDGMGSKDGACQGALTEIGSKPSHTPGPWECIQFCEPGNWSIYSAHQGCVAEIDHHRFAYEANARLIAAAPDLLDALKTLQSAYAYIPQGPRRALDYSELMEAASAKAKAAITKATGHRS